MDLWNNIKTKQIIARYVCKHPGVSFDIELTEKENVVLIKMTAQIEDCPFTYMTGFHNDQKPEC